MLASLSAATRQDTVLRLSIVCLVVVVIEWVCMGVYRPSNFGCAPVPQLGWCAMMRDDSLGWQ